MPKSALDFLLALFNDKPATHQILIWELNRQTDKKSNNFFTDIPKAVTFATRKKDDGTDTYFCVGTLTDKPRSGRGKIEDISGIGGLHLDVDIQNSLAHKKNNLPETIEKAIEFINGIELKPSALITSGYGLHAYWLFDKFWQFKDEADKLAAMKMLESWQRMFKWRAGHLGYDVDATQDITRVLRVPDTANWKIADQPVVAVVSELNNTRYIPEVINLYLEGMRKQLPPTPAPASTASVSSKAIVQAKNVTNLKPYNELNLLIDHTAKLDAAVFEALSNNVPNFKKTWERKRKDLQDTSGSSYDMALANMAMGAGLADQAIVNLLIAHRNKHNDEKLRLDYYQRTITEARNAMHGKREQIQAAKAPITTDKEEIKRQLSVLLGFKIHKLEKHLSEPPQYILYFNDGSHKNMGDSQGIIDQPTFRRHIANAIDHFVVKMKDDMWQPASQKMLKLADHIAVSEETTELGEIREIITTYVAENLQMAATDKTHKEAAARHAPGVIDGKVCINALELWKYAKRNYGWKKTKSELIGLLRRLGCERAVFNVRDDNNKQCCISTYTLPLEWLPEGAVAADEHQAETDDVHFAGKR